jgi:uncharacterized protein YbbK (DUF523 family)
LSTPRPPAEIHGGGGAEVLSGEARVIDDQGRDLSEAFRAGAHRSLELARLAGCKRAVFKERSPSCGVGQIHSAGKLLPGQGVTTALLLEDGIEVVSDEFPELQDWIHED